jgi:hypothetical protein
MTTRKLSRAARARRYLQSEAGRKLHHTAPAIVVFGVAAYQSYWHTVEVALRAGEATVTSHIMPLSVDGLMVVAARYVTHAKTRLGKVMAVVAFLLGISATLAANVMAAEPHWFNRAVAVWPAVALVGTACVLHWGEMKPKPQPRVKRVTAPVKLKAVA